MDYFRRPNRSSTTVDGVAIVSNSSNNITSVEASIKSKLVDSIKDIQADFGEGNPEKPIENNEQTHALVTAIEAIFIHGLKGQSSRAVKASSNRGQLPQPNFWTFVLYFSHRQMINRIDKLSAVTTDVGKGRAWIRLALNEEGLVSYLKTMCSDQVCTYIFLGLHEIFLITYFFLFFLGNSNKTLSTTCFNERWRHYGCLYTLPHWN